VETIRDESSSDAGVSLCLLRPALPPPRPPLLFSVTAEVASTARPPPAARCGGRQSSAATAGAGSMAAGGEATPDSRGGSRVSEVRAKGRAAGGDWCDQIREVGGEGELAVALCTLAEERAQRRLEKGGVE